ncbi:MAG: LLM class flavin-dependent oxidoreductase [Thermomicrobiales bacterium]|nr:LLM class flavin-dependent oxidoreductase [Thermomicrobiales bacterium]
MQRIGLELPGEPSVPETMAMAQRAEALGYESIWLTETRFTRDAVTTTAAAAVATRTARVATAVINPFTRSAVLIAVTAATLDELSGGRLVHGLGPGSPTVLARQGIEFARPLARLSETVDLVRRLLRGERVCLGGDTLSLAGAGLDFTPLRPAIPMYLGVTGPRALALAGTIADGVILNGFVSLAYTKRAVEIVRAAAGESGRDPGEVEIASSIVVSVADTSAAARDAVRPLVATYLAEFPNIAAESGVAGDLLDRIAATHRGGGATAAATLVDDGVVDALTCAGTITEVKASLASRRAAGVQLPIVSFCQSDMAAWLAELAEPVSSS